MAKHHDAPAYQPLSWPKQAVLSGNPYFHACMTSPDLSVTSTLTHGAAACTHSRQSSRPPSHACGTQQRVIVHGQCQAAAYTWPTLMTRQLNMSLPTTCLCYHCNVSLYVPTVTYYHYGSSSIHRHQYCLLSLSRRCEITVCYMPLIMNGCKQVRQSIDIVFVGLDLLHICCNIVPSVCTVCMHASHSLLI